jgi:hypothetical protein
MVIGFKQRFIKPILEKTKIHTFREDIPDRWKEGKKMHMATGIRSKRYNQFYLSTCKSTQLIEIICPSDYMNETIVKVDGRELNQDELRQLAYNDGFDNLVDFWMWFTDGFNGKIIHWTDLRY